MMENIGVALFIAVLVGLFGGGIYFIITEFSLIITIFKWVSIAFVLFVMFLFIIFMIQDGAKKL